MAKSNSAKGGKTRENGNYEKGPVRAIGGKYAKGDNRSKMHMGNIKPQKGC